MKGVYAMIILKTAFSCGKILPILDIMKFALTAIQWIVPILLILWGTIDLVKSVVAGKEDEIKKNQKALIKRIISAVIVFLIPLAVSMLLGLIGSDGWTCCWKQAKSQIAVSQSEIDARDGASNPCAAEFD